MAGPGGPGQGRRSDLGRFRSTLGPEFENGHFWTFFGPKNVIFSQENVILYFYKRKSSFFTAPGWVPSRPGQAPGLLGAAPAGLRSTFRPGDAGPGLQGHFGHETAREGTIWSISGTVLHRISSRSFLDMSRMLGSDFFFDAF